MATYLDELYEQIGKEVSEEELKMRKAIVDDKLPLLQAIKNSLMEYKAIQVVEQQKKMVGTKLAPILSQSQTGDKYSYLRFSNKISDTTDKVRNTIIIQKLLQSYNLIDEIAAALKLINIAPQLNLYYTNSKGQVHRIANLTAVVNKMEDYIVMETRSRGTRLKFDQQKLINFLEQKENRNEDLDQDVTEHYNHFLQIFAQSKVNQGIVIEAFERHWNLAKHLSTSPTENITKTEAWYLYGLSKGNDAFYTGGDTEDAQIKALNASIISNINTILNAMESLLGLLKSSTSKQNAQETIALYKQAFKQQEKDALAYLENDIIKDLDNEILERLQNGTLYK